MLYRRDAQLRLAECHEIRQRVRSATHSLIGASYRFRRDVHRKAGRPETFGIAFASMQCQERGIDHEITNFHPLVSHLAGTPQGTMVQSIQCARWFMR